MKAIIPLSPPSYKQGNLPGNVKDLCAYARNLQEQVDFYLGQLQKACADANTAMEQIQKGVESINALYNYSEETKTLNIIPATSFNSAAAVGGKLTVDGAATFGSTSEFVGKATFKDIAMHYNGSAVRGALVGTSGSNGYVRIMVITIKGEYVNSPILFEYVNRGRDPVSGYIRFFNSDGTDPGIDACRYSCPIVCPFYICKRAAGTWDVYVQKSEAYDNIGITRLSADYGYLGSRLNIEIDGGTIVPSLPSGYIAATPYNAYINSLTTIGKATLESASIGGNDVASVVIATNNGNTSNSSWAYRKYSDGTCDLWAYKQINVACSTALGGWYRSGNISMQDLPFSVSGYVFTYGFEIENDSGALLWNVAGISGTTGPIFYAIRPTSGAAKGWITVHVHGKWK